ncbi:N-terminal domain of BNR-repeat neuraminidase [Saccharicrinis carchari]|uniref:exo-alpha-sialidase n=1 Tax=Saccharicrinis carchari TaxID=1168039 RepID=A0A521BY64_SACCC|nr:exo-alpha-sialidase [Saccharicrinis carchari]SMO52142.1 N-terminal domain of BNR-repeat neuraminidase [Saccharicrinis carchari]
MKKRLSLFITLGFTLFILGFSTKAQVTPVVSTEAEPIWYSIESACTAPLGGGSYTGPTNLLGYALYPNTAENRIYARIAQGGDDELWALVDVDGVVKLKNKGSGLYMNLSHSLDATGGSFEFGALGDNQFWMRGGHNSYTLIWNGLKCDRWNSNQKDSNTAYYFKQHGDPKIILGATITIATNLKESLVGTNPGYISTGSPAIAQLDAAIADAQAVFDSNEETPDYSGATSALHTAMETFRNTARNPVMLSTPENETWYYLVSAATNDYCKNKVIVNRSSEPGVRLQFDDRKVDPNMLWKIVDAGSGKYGIQNMASDLFIAQDITQGTSTTIAPYNINPLAPSVQFSLYIDGTNPLHCQQNGSVIVAWPGGVDSPSAWRLEEVSNIQVPASITEVDVNHMQVTTGIGNSNFAFTQFSVNVEGFTGSPALEEVVVNLEGTTNLSDVQNLRIYDLGSDLRFNPAEHTLVGAAQSAAGNISFTISPAYNLSYGTNRFALVCDVSANALEGNLIKGSVHTAKLSGQTEFTVANPSPAFASTIFLAQHTLFSPGDYGSMFYRIPAIVTANDGSLVTATDKRINHDRDLPADIDLYIKRSVDNGITWSEPLMIAGQDTETGYGDAALVVEKESGKIFCLMASDRGFFQSTPASPIRIVVCESADNGITWSAPLDITNSIYGAGSSNPISQNWNGVFVASGRGLQLQNGRLMFAVAVRGTTDGIDNYVIYSDDKGATWNINTNMVHRHGDESKLAQRNNGDVIISIRNAGTREWNISQDNGDTWGTSTNHPDLIDPNCNGEIMTYTSTLDGYDKNRMLHSLAYASNRSNVSMLISYDEGLTFPIVKTICPAPSAYSTFTILEDGTIGMYYEDGSIGGGFDMVFVRFSLEWLTDGADIYMDPNVSVDNITQDSYKVWSSNKQIIVEGLPANSYQIYNISGIKVSTNKNLSTGIYIVDLGTQKVKVFVK